MFIELPGLPSAYQSGQNAGNFIAGVADKAADFVCDLYQGYPGALIRSPIGTFNRGLMDSLCGPRDKLPPPPTQPPFSGGQCDCTVYTVVYQYTTGEGFTLGPFSASAPGPIRGLTSRPNPGLEDADTVVLLHSDCSSGTAKPAETEINQGAAPISGLVILEVTPAIGSPDDCGDPPPSWDPDLPDVIPDGEKGGDITINNNDGTSITLPILLIGSGNVFNFNPEIKVDVGGINITFDFSGAKIDFGNNNSNPELPPPRNNDNADNFARIEDAINRINDKLDNQGEDIENIKKDRNDSPPPDEDPDIEKEEDEEESESGEKEVDKLQYVCVHLTKLPNREQWGDGAPNVYYAGWLEFKLKDCNLPRQPIHFKDSIFKAPDGATGFAYTLTNGAKGRVTVYKAKS